MPDVDSFFSLWLHENERAWIYRRRRQAETLKHQAGPYINLIRSALHRNMKSGFFCIEVLQASICARAQHLPNGKRGSVEVSWKRLHICSSGLSALQTGFVGLADLCTEQLSFAS